MGKSPSAWWNWSDDLANDEQILAVTLGIGDIVREYFLRVSVDKTLLRAREQLETKYGCGNHMWDVTPSKFGIFLVVYYTYLLSHYHILRFLKKFL